MSLVQKDRFYWTPYLKSTIIFAGGKTKLWLLSLKWKGPLRTFPILLENISLRWNKLYHWIYYTKLGPTDNLVLCSNCKFCLVNIQKLIFWFVLVEMWPYGVEGNLWKRCLCLASGNVEVLWYFWKGIFKWHTILKMIYRLDLSI